MDPATAKLILELQLQDVEDLKAASNSKQPDGGLEDSQLALLYLQAELRKVKDKVNDQANGGLAIDAGASADLRLVNQVLRDEDIALTDRQLAQRLSGLPESQITAKRTFAIYNESVETNIARVLANDIPRGTVEPGEKRLRLCQATEPGSAANFKDLHPSRSKQAECTACTDTMARYDMATVACGHDYCIGCLEKLFQTALGDESIFPPNCCGKQIHVQTVQAFLPDNYPTLYEEKKVEYSTANRTYCSTPGCGKFIPPKEIKASTGYCKQCRYRTCVNCKSQAHQGLCPKDPATEVTMRLASEKGWRQCYRCRTMVELNHGCNHIRCRCKAEFCYECGLKWKTCKCPQWRETRLYALGEQPDTESEGEDDDDFDSGDDLCDHEHRVQVDRPGPHHCTGCDRDVEVIFYCDDCEERMCSACFLDDIEGYGDEDEEANEREDNPEHANDQAANEHPEAEIHNDNGEEREHLENLHALHGVSYMDQEALDNFDDETYMDDNDYDENNEDQEDFNNYDDEEYGNEEEFDDYNEESYMDQEGRCDHPRLSRIYATSYYDRSTKWPLPGQNVSSPGSQSFVTASEDFSYNDIASDGERTVQEPLFWFGLDEVRDDNVPFDYGPISASAAETSVEDMVRMGRAQRLPLLLAILRSQVEIVEQLLFNQVNIPR